jgi:hypothetical protein
MVAEQGNAALGGIANVSACGEAQQVGALSENVGT